MTINRIDSIMPPFLKKGDQVEIVAPAKFVLESDINYSIKFLKKMGFNIKTNVNLFNKKDVFSGTIDQRIDNINSAFRDNETKAIFFARGGYGSIQIVDYLDFNFLYKNPKWLIGFSDATTILMHVYFKYNINAMHGPMPYNFKQTSQESLVKMISVLKGEKEAIEVAYNNLNVTGLGRGKIIGGNLSIICSLIGSNSFNHQNEDYILFIEDVDEYLYQLERMLYMLDREGILKKIKGFIIGQMTDIRDNEMPFGKTAHELIHQIVKKYNYPVCFGFPVGHAQKNHPIIIGAKTKLEVNKEFSKISYEE